MHKRPRDATLREKSHRVGICTLRTLLLEGGFWKGNMITILGVVELVRPSFRIVSRLLQVGCEWFCAQFASHPVGICTLRTLLLEGVSEKDIMLKILGVVHLVRPTL